VRKPISHLARARAAADGGGARALPAPLESDFLGAARAHHQMLGASCQVVETLCHLDAMLDVGAALVYQCVYEQGDILGAHQRLPSQLRLGYGDQVEAGVRIDAREELLLLGQMLPVTMMTPLYAIMTNVTMGNKVKFIHVMTLL
jgi:hypothetical protein